MARQKVLQHRPEQIGTGALEREFIDLELDLDTAPERESAIGPPVGSFVIG